VKGEDVIEHIEISEEDPTTYPMTVETTGGGECCSKSIFKSWRDRNREANSTVGFIEFELFELLEVEVEDEDEEDEDEDEDGGGVVEE